MVDEQIDIVYRCVLTSCAQRSFCPVFIGLHDLMLSSASSAANDIVNRIRSEKTIAELATGYFFFFFIIAAP